MEEKQSKAEQERIVKNWLIHKVLAGNGFYTFAKYLIDYDVHLTDNPMVAARMFPNEGVIEINNFLDDEDLISVLIRHELLHFILEHTKKAIIQLAKKYKIDPHHMKKSEYRKLRDEVFKRQLVPGLEKYGKVSFSNVAGDWDISHYYSKDKDFDKIKNGLFQGSPLGGLILELDRPELLDLSYEELINKLEEEERAYRRKAYTEIQGVYQDEDHFLPDKAAEEVGS